MRYSNLFDLYAPALSFSHPPQFFKTQFIAQYVLTFPPVCECLILALHAPSTLSSLITHWIRLFMNDWQREKTPRNLLFYQKSIIEDGH